MTLLHEYLNAVLVVPFESGAFFCTQWGKTIRIRSFLDIMDVEIVVEFVESEPGRWLDFLLLGINAYLS